MPLSIKKNVIYGLEHEDGRFTRNEIKMETIVRSYFEDLFVTKRIEVYPIFFLGGTTVCL